MEYSIFQKAFSRVVKENNINFDKSYPKPFFNVRLDDIKRLPSMYLPKDCSINEFFAIRNEYFNLIRKEYNEIVKKYFLYLLEINGIRLHLKKDELINRTFLMDEISITNGLIDNLNVSRNLKDKIFMTWNEIKYLNYNEITLEKIYEINKKI